MPPRPFVIKLSKMNRVSDFVDHKHLNFAENITIDENFHHYLWSWRFMLKIRSRNVRLSKLDHAVAKFLAKNDVEEKVLSHFFALILAKPGRVIEGKDIAKFRREHKIAKSTMHKFLHNLKENEILKFQKRFDRSLEKMNYFYYLDPKFFKMLGKVRKSYHRMLLISG